VEQEVIVENERKHAVEDGLNWRQKSPWYGGERALTDPQSLENYDSSSFLKKESEDIPHDLSNATRAVSLQENAKNKAILSYLRSWDRTQVLFMIFE
jgi:hypothetical protein